MVKRKIIYLKKLMPKYAKMFHDLTESEYAKDREKGFLYSEKWNEIRKIVEFQEGECVE